MSSDKANNVAEENSVNSLLPELEAVAKRLDEQRVPIEILIRGLIDLQTDGYSVVENKKMTFVEVTHAFARLFGYKPDDLLNCSIDRLIEPEKQDTHRKKVEEWLRAPCAMRMDGREPVSGITRTGEIVRLKIGLTPFKGVSLVMVQVVGGSGG